MQIVGLSSLRTLAEIRQNRTILKSWYTLPLPSPPSSSTALTFSITSILITLKYTKSTFFFFFFYQGTFEPRSRYTRDPEGSSCATHCLWGALVDLVLGHCSGSCSGTGSSPQRRGPPPFPAALFIHFRRRGTIFCRPVISQTVAELCLCLLAAVKDKIKWILEY